MGPSPSLPEAPRGAGIATKLYYAPSENTGTLAMHATSLASRRGSNRGRTNCSIVALCAVGASSNSDPADRSQLAVVTHSLFASYLLGGPYFWCCCWCCLSPCVEVEVNVACTNTNCPSSLNVFHSSSLSGGTQ